MIDVVKCELQELPKKFFEISSQQLIELYSKPTLIHIKGRNPQAVYVSTMLHGNEYSSWEAVKCFIKNKKELERDLILFIGNVSAAAQNKRVLPGQNDYNRVWKDGESDEHSMAREVLEYLNNYKNIFAAIDIHNNTGRNPLYACVNKIHAEDIKLASLFSSRIVFFLTPQEVQSVALSKNFPAVTLECGKPGNENGILTIVNMLEKLMSLTSWDDVKVSLNEDIHMYHTIAKILLDKDCHLSFDPTDESADAWADEELESYNFEILQEGTRLLKLRNPHAVLKIKGEDSSDLSLEYLDYRSDGIFVKKDFIPSMFTKNVEVIHQDCFGYIMEKMQLLQPLS